MQETTLKLCVEVSWCQEGFKKQEEYQGRKNIAMTGKVITKYTGFARAADVMLPKLYAAE